MIFQRIQETLTAYKARVFFLAAFIFGAYIIFVIRPVFVLRQEMNVSFDSLLQRMALAKKSFLLSRQDDDLPSFADKIESSEALSLVQALAMEEKIEVDDIRVRKAPKKGALLDIRMHGQEGALMRFMGRLKELPFLARIVSLHIKAVSRKEDSLQAVLCLEAMDFSHQK